MSERAVFLFPYAEAVTLLCAEVQKRRLRADLSAQEAARLARVEVRLQEALGDYSRAEAAWICGPPEKLALAEQSPGKLPAVARGKRRFKDHPWYGNRKPRG